MTEELRRLEYARRNARDYKTKSKTGLIGYESGLKARQSNAVHTKLLSTKLQTIKKEEAAIKCEYAKSLYKVRKLRASILRPVSRGIVESQKLVDCDGPVVTETKKHSARYLQPLAATAAFRNNVLNRRPKSKMKLKQELNYESVVKSRPLTRKAVCATDTNT